MSKISKIVAIVVLFLSVPNVSFADPLPGQAKNGCGPGGILGRLVPDRTVITNCKLRKACNKHDFCYGRCLEGGNLFQSPACDDDVKKARRRKTCDNALYNNIVGDNGGRFFCKIYANTYYLSARALGKGLFHGLRPIKDANIYRRDFGTEYDIFFQHENANFLELKKYAEALEGASEADQHGGEEALAALRQLSNLGLLLGRKIVFEELEGQPQLAVLESDGSGKLSAFNLKNGMRFYRRRHLKGLDVSRLTYHGKPFDISTVLSERRSVDAENLIQTDRFIHRGQRHITAFGNAAADPFNDTAFAAYLKTLPQISLPIRPEHRYFLVESDIILQDEDAVRNYLIAKKKTGEGAEGSAKPHKPELKVNLVKGEKDYWKEPGERHLTYAVIQSSFPNTASYNQVVADIKAATSAWVNACGKACGIKFTHVTSHDLVTDSTAFENLLRDEKVTFLVMHHDVGGEYIAAAFFPSDPWFRRIVTIDPSYFDTSPDAFNPVGVLRHEIGHTLGYRHEHIDGVIGCYQEDDKYLPLTPYDPDSLMHYFCGGAGSQHLEISSIDKEGHRKLYGGGS